MRNLSYTLWGIITLFASISTQLPFVLMSAIRKRNKLITSMILWLIVLSVVSIIFKNILIALTLNWNNGALFSFYRGLDIVFIGLASLLILLKNKTPTHPKTITFSLMSIIACVYLIASYLNEKNLIDSIIYFRMLLIPLFAYIIGKWLSDTNINISHIITPSLVIMSVYLVCEILLFQTIHDTLDTIAYERIKNPNLTKDDLLSLNGMTILGTRFQRLYGTTMHPITAGYLISFMFLYFSLETKLLRRSIINRLIFLIGLSPFLFLTSKGALLLTTAIFALSITYNIKERKLVLTSIFSAYLFFLIYISYTDVTNSSAGDHYYFLITSIKIFLSNPLGTWIAFTNMYDTFLGFTLVSMGIFGVLYYILTLRLCYYPISLNNKKYFMAFMYFLLLLINSVLHIEPWAPAGIFLSSIYLHYIARREKIRNIALSHPPAAHISHP